ncbi:tight adherence protein B [Roseivivax lentus]|uniref:Tight adherence protein B n=1 Tax=Roseivivax lentus TaxID=633194 RepID=A0A1N7M9G2_9RHOB|nr:type II secretion system F family protein [Roseivivax lentus]SIS82601.1 tight adherence protein B [Roseivivax lentus]
MIAEYLQSLQQADILRMLLILLGALLAVEGIRQIASEETRDLQTRNRRMRMIAKGVDESKIVDALMRNAREADTGGRGPWSALEKRFARTDLRFGPAVGLAGALALTVVIYFFAQRSLSPALAGLFAVGFGLGLPFAMLDRLAEARAAKLSEQLPDAIDMMARGLRIGHPINVTLRRVARDMPDPIGSEFGLIEDRVRAGLELGEAFSEFAARIDTEDMHYLSATIRLQHRTGGNLARVLGVLSRVIRGRLNMRKKIGAISAEGRLSGIILTMMPFIIVGTIHASTPSFFLDVADHPIFMPVAAAVLALVALQGIILHRLTNFDF